MGKWPGEKGGMGYTDPFGGLPVVIIATTATTSTSTTRTPPMIVNINKDVTLWAVYSPTGMITPMYSTNLKTSPIEWKSISIFTNSFINGTNVIDFDSPDINANAIFYQLWQTP